MNTRNAQVSSDAVKNIGDVNDPLTSLSEEQVIASLAYTSNLYNIVGEWYRNADSKAQAILTLDGVFLAFLTTSMFVKKDELLLLIKEFNALILILLSLMCVTLLGSIGCALYCLISRLYNSTEVKDRLKAADDAQNLEALAEVISFFQFIGRGDLQTFRGRLKNLDKRLELRAISSQNWKLSRNVLKKHLAVNIGFVLAALSLFLFLAGGISYVVKVYIDSKG